MRHDEELPRNESSDHDLIEGEIGSPIREDPDAHATPGGAAVAGAVTGGVVGLAGGPIGAVVGAVGGAIVGAITERVIHANEELPDDEEPMPARPPAVGDEAGGR